MKAGVLLWLLALALLALGAKWLLCVILIAIVCGILGGRCFDNDKQEEESEK
jgi:hypothetical protein